jgi:hypothetical protein
MKKTLLLVLAILITILMIFGILLFAQTPATTPQSPGQGELPTDETPQGLLVIPEVPLGTIATISACFLALIISQLKNRTKLQ